MSSPTVDTRKRVLIVDRSEDSRDVLRTILQRRGVDILEAPEPQLGLETVRRYHPDVVVLDLESDAREDSESLQAAFDAELDGSDTPLVLLGNVRRTNRPADHVVQKPYHYGPLVRKIEQLVNRSKRQR